MIDLVKREETELAEWILENLPSTGYLTFDCIAKSWAVDVGEAWVRETLERLENDGKVTSMKDSTRWRLRTDPVVVREIPGNPNFRRGV